MHSTLRGRSHRRILAEAKPATDVYARAHIQSAKVRPVPPALLHRERSLIFTFSAIFHPPPKYSTLRRRFDFPPSHLPPTWCRFAHDILCAASRRRRRWQDLNQSTSSPLDQDLYTITKLASKQARCVATVTPAFVCRGMKRVMQNGVKIFAFHKYPAGENPLFPHILRYIHRLRDVGRVSYTNTLPKSARICALWVCALIEHAKSH